MNVQGVGPTRSGKSTGIASYFDKWLKKCMLILDPHGSLTEKAAERLVRTPVIYDRLSRTDKVLQWEFLSPSKKRGLDQRIENERRVRGFADVLVRDRGMTTLAKTPLIEEGIITVLEAWMERPTVPLYELYRAFDPSDPVFEMIENDRLTQWRFMSRHQLRQEFGAAERIFRRVLRSPCFRARVGEEWGHDEWLNEGGVILVDGSGVSISDMRITLGAISQKIQQDARDGLFTQPVTLVIDEASKLIGGHEANALEETQKFNLNILLLDQDGDYGPWTDAVWQNCERTEVYGVNSPELAQKLAHMMKTPSLEADLVREDVEVWRQLHNGYYYDEEHDRHLAEYRDVADSRKTYRSLNDQIQLFEKDLMNLKINERMIKQGNKVWKETFEEFGSKIPWKVKRKKCKRAHNWIEELGTDPSGNFCEIPMHKPRPFKKVK